MFAFKDIITKGPFRGDSVSECSELSKVCGVYVWRRALPAIPGVVFEQENYEKWLETALAVPYVSAKNLTLLSHKDSDALSIRKDFLRISRLEIGGERLSNKKNLDLGQLNTVKKRTSFMNFLDKVMSNMGPVLYVGEADDIKTRMEDHATSNSPLQKRLADLGLTLAETTVIVFWMKGSSKDERTLLEQILTYLLISPLSFRAG